MVNIKDLFTEEELEILICNLASYQLEDLISNGDRTEKEAVDEVIEYAVSGFNKKQQSAVKKIIKNY